MKFSTLLIALPIAGLLAGGFFYFRDTSAPQLALRPDSGPVAGKQQLQLELQDGAGLKDVQVTAIQGGKSMELVNRSFGSEVRAQIETFTLQGAGLADGPVELRVAAGDRSPYHFGRGNRAERTFTLDFDSKPPVVSALSTAHNLNQGGVGLVVYTVSEEPAKTGVQVGSYFFPGFRQEGNVYASFFAFPYDMKMADFNPRLIAVDRAGNERVTGFYYHVNARSFPQDKINVTPQFLASKMPEFQSLYPDTGDLLQLFLRVNRETREANVKALLEVGRKTAPRPLWEGTFLRQPNSAPRGLFAETRTYYHEGKEVDRQVHLGHDLASLAQSPIVAANRGEVVFVEDFGIYGQCVIIDHGLGLQTLYAHLSSMQVKTGDKVEKGQTIGHSGATGMAGGDHLHFGVLVSGLQVLPLEWWDPSWLENNVNSKLTLVPGR